MEPAVPAATGGCKRVRSGDAAVTFDLIVWPVDRALALDEAVAEVDRLGGLSSFGLGHDKRLDAFIAAMEQRYPGLRGRGPVLPPCEFDVRRKHVFIGIPWSMVEEITTAVAEAAWRTGLAVYDPQREAVGLPAPFAETPMTAEGVERHVPAAADALDGAIRTDAELAPEDDPATAQHTISARLAAAGFLEISPLGFQITPDVAEEVLADPLRMPSSLQTPERKAELIDALTTAKVGPRHVALSQLAGWDPDADVAEALRLMLPSQDVFEAGQAAAGLARQRDITDLPGVLDVVHRFSPADGGTTEAMLLPLRAALSLAALAGPEIVEGVKGRAREWRGASRVRRQSWEQEFDRDLDELLAEG